MKRIKITPRPDWEAQVENLGFGFHTLESIYWDESAYYEFTMREIETIEKATAELWTMCLDAVEHVIQKKLYSKFHIPQWVIPHIEKSWNDDAPSIYGRFDFTFRKGVPKLLEFNADTPTSLFETGVVQWDWLQSVAPDNDQFNSVHEKLVAYWRTLRKYLHRGEVVFTCVKDSLEDTTTTEYMRDTAVQAGLTTRFEFLEDLGWDEVAHYFVNSDDEPIKNIFKLYPWEWLLHDEFGKHLMEDRIKAHWIEPSWKMILSNKAILAILWELFPHCPYLLPTYFDSVDLNSYVRKPLLSREGANIQVVKNNQFLMETEGEYGEEGYIYQELCELPTFDGNHVLVGSWVIGQEPAGIGLRESDSMITDNGSRFLPHLIV
jgi:glutathionylspermidine synthase